jgi:hypothetical protein
MRCSYSISIVAITAAMLAGSVWAKLPAPSDEAKEKAALAAAKTAWSDKVSAYQTCQSMNRVADSYRKTAKAAGKPASAPVATPACADPGPFVPPVAAAAPVAPAAAEAAKATPKK